MELEGTKRRPISKPDIRQTDSNLFIKKPAYARVYHSGTNSKHERIRAFPLNRDAPSISD